MERERIEIAVAHKKTLAIEFNKSGQAVQMSLDYVFNSDNAKAIRQRAKELLMQEAEKISL